MALPTPTDQAIDKAADLERTGLADEGRPAATMARAVATERATSWRAPAACDDLSGSFLAPQCQLGKTGRAHPMHPAYEAGNRVATVSIGKPGATNAGVLAAQMIALGDSKLAGRLVAYKAGLAAKVEAAAEPTGRWRPWQRNGGSSR